MKCHIMWQFIRVYTAKENKRCSDKKYNILFLVIINWHPFDMYNGLSQVYCIKPEGRIHQNTKGQNENLMAYQ